MTEIEQPPQNGIDPTVGEDDENSKARPADIEQDMREMERRKRVEAIMGSRLFREELERIVDSAREGGAGASGILQQLSDIVGIPVNRVGSVFKSSNCMVPINDIRGVESMGYAKGEKILRCKLAATFRLLDLYGWTQGLGAQITARLKVDQEYFLVNPYGLLYHEITASSLNKVDMQGQIVEQGTTNFGVNKSHFGLHSVVHAARPDIRCAIYIGCSPVVAISSLKSGLLPLTKDACVLGEITTHAYTGLFDEEERNRLVRSLGPNSKVILLANHGALCCGETIEEAFFAACHIVQACETQLKLLPVGVDNLVLIPEDSRKVIYEQSRRPPEDLEKKFAAVTAEDGGAAAPKEDAPPKVGSPPKWRVGGAEFEALMRMLDNAGYRTGYIYRHPLIKSDPPKPKNDVELPPAVSSLGYLLEEEELFRQGIWKKGDLRKGGDRSRWLNSPNVYQKVEVLETGTPDPKKITKWVAEGSPTHSTPVRIEDPLQFVPAGTNTKEFKRVQQQIKDNRRADKISAGPQSHILEGVTWDEANRIKDATVSQTGDHVVLMGAASKGIIQRGFQHNATVYKAPYAKNPFDNVTDDELNEYKRTVERKKKSIHGEYTDTDFSESEALNSMQAAGALAHAKHAQSEPETEHQVIQIQTQQAPIPSQAEVVLSDATLSFINGERSHTATNRKPPTGRVTQVRSADAADRINKSLYDELDKENQRSASVSASTSKCRRGLFAVATTNHTNPNPTIEASGLDLVQQQNVETVPRSEYYSYPYVCSTVAPFVDSCSQPEVCLTLLGTLQPSHHHQYYYRSTATSTTGTISTNASSTPRRPPLRQANPLHPPYRTVSHFGFNSPRQPPRMEHKHLPIPPPGYSHSNTYNYRPMQRAISYEEIFATPRYEKLCQPCFDQLLRLKPEIQRNTASAPQSSSSCEDDIVSAGSSTDIHRHRKLPTLPELEDELVDNSFDYELMLQPPGITHASTQTPSSSCPNFLNLIERLNFSEESNNVNYVAGQQTTITSDFSIKEPMPTPSPGASPTSGPPPPKIKSLEQANAPIANVTEIWDFGNWQERPAEKGGECGQQPLTEHRVTLEISQPPVFDHQEQQQQQSTPTSSRQITQRDERQQRKSEFQELWEDHVEYYAAKEHDREMAPIRMDNTVQIALDKIEIRSWLGESNPVQDANDDKETFDEIKAISNETVVGGDSIDESMLSEPKVIVDELPQILQEFEESLSLAGENLGKLVETSRKFQEHLQHDTTEESEVETPETCSIIRSITFENLPSANDGLSITEPIHPNDISSNSDDNETIEADVNDSDQQDHEEKCDDEKPLTPSSLITEESTTEKEKVHLAEKDVDEIECPIASEIAAVIEDVFKTDTVEMMTLPASSHEIPTTSTAQRSESPQERSHHDSPSCDIFSPIEREILQRINDDKLKEDDAIFSRIDHSIRNKMTPSKLQNTVSEETFRTCTHIYSPLPATTSDSKTPCAPSSSSSLSSHNISAPCSSKAHTHVIIRQVPRSAPCSCCLAPKLSLHQVSRSSSTSVVDTSRREALQRTVSSTTFIYPSSLRKRRNFIQENIRNAFKPRCDQTIRTNQKRWKPVLSDTSSLCTFQSGQRDSGARLWVSLPTPPRSNKRNSAGPHRQLYISPRTPSPYAIRRRPPGQQLLQFKDHQCGGFMSTPYTSNASFNCSLSRTLSSSTFLVGNDENEELDGSLHDSVSTETFEFELDETKPLTAITNSPTNGEEEPVRLIGGEGTTEPTTSHTEISEGFEEASQNDKNETSDNEDNVEESPEKTSDDYPVEECTTSDIEELLMQEVIEESSFGEPSANQVSKNTEEEEDEEEGEVAAEIDDIYVTSSSIDQLVEESNNDIKTETKLKFNSQVTSEMDKSMDFEFESDKNLTETESNIPGINFNLETTQEAAIRGSSITEQNSDLITNTKEKIETENCKEFELKTALADKMSSVGIVEENWQAERITLTSAADNIGINYERAEEDEIDFWHIMPQMEASEFFDKSLIIDDDETLSNVSEPSDEESKLNLPANDLDSRVTEEDIPISKENAVDDESSEETNQSLLNASGSDNSEAQTKSSDSDKENLGEDQHVDDDIQQGELDGNFLTMQNDDDPGTWEESDVDDPNVNAVDVETSSEDTKQSLNASDNDNKEAQIDSSDTDKEDLGMDHAIDGMDDIQQEMQNDNDDPPPWKDSDVDDADSQVETNSSVFSLTSVSGTICIGSPKEVEGETDYNDSDDCSPLEKVATDPHKRNSSSDFSTQDDIPHTSVKTECPKRSKGGAEPELDDDNDEDVVVLNTRCILTNEMQLNVTEEPDEVTSDDSLIEVMLRGCESFDDLTDIPDLYFDYRTQDEIGPIDVELLNAHFQVIEDNESFTYSSGSAEDEEDATLMDDGEQYTPELVTTIFEFNDMIIEDDPNCTMPELLTDKDIEEVYRGSPDQEKDQQKNNESSGEDYNERYVNVGELQIDPTTADEMLLVVSQCFDEDQQRELPQTNNDGEIDLDENQGNVDNFDNCKVNASEEVAEHDLHLIAASLFWSDLQDIEVEVLNVDLPVRPSDVNLIESFIDNTDLLYLVPTLNNSELHDSGKNINNKEDNNTMQNAGQTAVEDEAPGDTEDYDFESSRKFLLNRLISDDMVLIVSQNQPGNDNSDELEDGGDAAVDGKKRNLTNEMKKSITDEPSVSLQNMNEDEVQNNLNNGEILNSEVIQVEHLMIPISSDADYLTDSSDDSDLIYVLQDVELATCAQDLEDRIADINEMIMEETKMSSPNDNDNQTLVSNMSQDNLNQLGLLKRKNTSLIDIDEPASQKSKESTN